jgi:hypothetical protein
VKLSSSTPHTTSSRNDDPEKSRIQRGKQYEWCLLLRPTTAARNSRAYTATAEGEAKASEAKQQATRYVALHVTHTRELDRERERGAVDAKLWVMRPTGVQRLEGGEETRGI